MRDKEADRPRMRDTPEAASEPRKRQYGGAYGVPLSPPVHSLLTHAPPLPCHPRSSGSLRSPPYPLGGIVSRLWRPYGVRSRSPPAARMEGERKEGRTEAAEVKSG